MKTKEFISKMDDVAGHATASSEGIHIYNFDGKKVGWVSIDDFGVVDTSYIELDNMKNKEEVVKLLFGYALTPLGEREDELKFYVRMIPKDSIGNWDVYLNLNKEDSCIFVDDSCDDSNAQTIFTKSEYDKLQKKYSKWLPVFDKDDPHFEFWEEEK